MIQVQLYKSSLNGFTGTKDEVIENDKQFKAEQKAEENRLAAIKDADIIKNSIRLNATSVDDIEKRLNEYGKEHGYKYNGETVYFKVTFQNVFYTTNVSNSHAAPIGGVRNWGQKSDKPTGYPGWRGQIEIERIGKSKAGSLSSCASHVPGIHTGTGGGGSFELRMYMSDFQKIEKLHADFSELHDEHNDKNQKHWSRCNEEQSLLNAGHTSMQAALLEMQEIDDEIMKLKKRRDELSDNVQEFTNETYNYVHEAEHNKAAATEIENISAQLNDMARQLKISRQF